MLSARCWLSWGEHRLQAGAAGPGGAHGGRLWRRGAGVAVPRAESAAGWELHSSSPHPPAPAQHLPPSRFPSQPLAGQAPSRSALGRAVPPALLGGWRGGRSRCRKPGWDRGGVSRKCGVGRGRAEGQRCPSQAENPPNPPQAGAAWANEVAQPAPGQGGLGSAANAGPGHGHGAPQGRSAAAASGGEQKAPAALPAAPGQGDGGQACGTTLAPSSVAWGPPGFRGLHDLGTSVVQGPPGLRDLHGSRASMIWGPPGLRGLHNLGTSVAQGPP